VTSSRQLLRELRAAADPSRKPGMARVGIAVDHALGVSVPDIRRIAGRAGVDHDAALRLWDTRIHEARILATLVADPFLLTPEEAERWVTGIDSWDVGDAAADLFARTPHARRMVRGWSARPEAYVRRCAFAMIARRAVSDREASDAAFVRLFPLIRRAATDDRNEVKKAVSWALRQIGKRNETLRVAAIAEAERVLELDARPARWIAHDVLRELRSEAVIARITPSRASRPARGAPRAARVPRPR
jgi:3-methyladenine DNA glycosylase AlkD